MHTAHASSQDWKGRGRGTGGGSRLQPRRCQQQRQHRSALCSALAISVLKEFVALGANTDAPDEDGSSALHIACFYGNVEAVAAILAAGPDIDAVAYDGFTPLYVGLLQLTPFMQLSARWQLISL